MKGLKGRVACVTGAAQGIGQEICVRLASEGAKIAVLDIQNTEITVNRCLDAGSHSWHRKRLALSMDIQSI